MKQQQSSIFFLELRKDRNKCQNSYLTYTFVSFLPKATAHVSDLTFDKFWLSLAVLKNSPLPRYDSPATKLVEVINIIITHFGI